MNERILELAAKVLVKHKMSNQGGIYSDKIFYEFGQLIVKECLDICEQKVKAYDLAGNEYEVVKNFNRELCIKALKEHFGEEDV